MADTRLSICSAQATATGFITSLYLQETVIHVPVGCPDHSLVIYTLQTACITLYKLVAAWLKQSTFLMEYANANAVLHPGAYTNKSKSVTACHHPADNSGQAHELDDGWKLPSTAVLWICHTVTKLPPCHTC